jgi:hypothetical protein
MKTKMSEKGVYLEQFIQIKTNIVVSKLWVNLFKVSVVDMLEYQRWDFGLDKKRGKLA